MTIVNTYTHPFPLPLEKTALLVIDMQNDFCHPDGFNGSELGLDMSAVRSIIPAVQTLLTWARQTGVKTIFTRESHSANLSDLSASKKVRYANAGSPIGQVGKMGRFLVRGEPGVAIIEELQPLPEEWQLDKPAHSCFVHTSLDQTLQAHGVTHLLIAGVTTQCCVLATYRHGNDLGYHCLLLDDCCAAFDPKDHVATLQTIQSEGGVLGWVAHSSKLYEATITPSLVDS
ncbi:MAG: isochorismatase family cysteine hydrolase [Cyanobacteria bacterium J06581_3]